MRALASYRTNSFFACGDFDQRITPWGSKRRSDLEWVSPGIEIKPVSISYRQSRQLFDFARALAALFETHGEVELPPEMNNDAVDRSCCSTRRTWMTSPLGCPRGSPRSRLQ